MTSILHLAQWFKDQLQLVDIDASQSRELTGRARWVKEQLSENASVDVVFELFEGEPSLTVTREVFDGLIESLVKRTLSACRRALKDAQISLDEVAEMVLVGGSTRVPAVRERVETYFKRAPHVNIDPDRVVAVGAAIQADLLAGNKPDSEMLLLGCVAAVAWVWRQWVG